MYMYIWHDLGLGRRLFSRHSGQYTPPGWRMCGSWWRCKNVRSVPTFDNYNIIIHPGFQEPRADDYRDSEAITNDDVPAGSAFTVDSVAAVVAPGAGESFLDVSGRGYVHADGQDFADGPFDRVTVVNADDNLLRLDTFRTFKTVWRLSLRRNRLQSVEPYARLLPRYLLPHLLPRLLPRLPRSFSRVVHRTSTTTIFLF